MLTYWNVMVNGSICLLVQYLAGPIISWCRPNVDIDFHSSDFDLTAHDGPSFLHYPLPKLSTINWARRWLTFSIDVFDLNQCCGQTMFWFDYKPVIHRLTNDGIPEIITEFINSNYMETKGLNEFCEKESLFRTWHLPLQRWQGRKKFLKTWNIIDLVVQ